MNNNKIIIGLDIGTTKICAMVGVRNDKGKINVLGIGRSPSLGGVTEGMVSNINKTSEAIGNAVRMASAQSGVNIARVYVGIAGRHIRSFTQTYNTYRSNPEAEITEEELEEMRQRMFKLTTEPGSRILHVLPQEYRIDEYVSDDPVGMPGTKFDVNYHIITGQMLAAENIKKCIEKCNVEVEDIVVEPIASAKAVLTEEELHEGVAILDIGGGTSDLAIFHEGRIRHTTVIPIGGQKITKDISEAFRIMESHAEAMKVRYGNALPEDTRANEVVIVPGINGRQSKQVSVRHLSQVINARLKELFAMVDKEIQHSGYFHKLTAGLVVTGGGAELKNISQFLEYTTGLEVKIGYPNQHLANGIAEEVKSPMYATGAGLVIYGIEKEVSENKQIGNVNEPLNTGGKSPTGGKNFFNKIKDFSGSMLDFLKDDDVDGFNEKK
jgi:cell division protein FtsA